VEKIVVTGSCGFIGYNFIKSNSSNFKIIGIDSLNNAYDNRLKELRLSSLNEEPNFTFKLLNLSDENTLDKESEIFENVSTVLHLGARAGVRQSFLDPKSYILDNTAATANLALNVKKHKIKKFIIASTSSIYGDTGVGYAKENKDELENPPSIYAATKSFGEVLARNILEDTDTIIQIPRFFTVYGPFGRPDMSILRFIHWISTNQEVIIYGDGEQKRSFTFISDIISGLNKLFIHDDSGIFNFGSNETWSLNQVIDLIEKKLNKKAIIVNRERAIKDVDIVLPSLELSKSILNWEPTTNIKDGISATVEWYKNNENELKEIKFKYDYE
tara:strand:- start:1509 stop:2498 length:990 start_codon:yes stop_codon:yes gene_type:complete